MNSEWARIEEVFHRAAELPPLERDAYLDEALAEEASLRRAVEALLAADASNETSQFIEQPILGEQFRMPAPAELAGPKSERRDERVGPYRLVRRIGEGGMGDVYLGERVDGAFVTRVAVKLINTPFPSDRALERFRRERQTLANLNHPNIARLLDGGATGSGLPYLVMEYVEGQPIDSYCREKALSIRQRLTLFLVVCKAVQHAHQNFVVHRDLKPSNILVTSDGTPKLLDFGIAQELDVLSQPCTEGHVTQTATVLTPEYASPEQLQQQTVTAATDVYALGVVLYELLTDRRPFQLESESIATVERIVCTEEPPKPSTALRQSTTTIMDPSHESHERSSSPPSHAITAERQRRRKLLRGDLDNIVLMAIRKEPERRYQTVEQLADDIQRYLRAEPVAAAPVTLVYRVKKFIVRHRVPVGATAIIAVLLVGATISSAWLARAASNERDAAKHAHAAERAARLRAERAEAEAARKADQAQDATDFLASLFRIADPYQNPGTSVDAKQIIERGKSRLETELADQPELQASLLSTLGEVYANIGSYDEAIQLLERSTAIFESVENVPSLEYSRALARLGRAQRALGRLKDAETTLHRVLEIRQSIVGESDDSYAQALIELGEINAKLGHYDEAEAQFDRARAVLEASPEKHALMIGKALSGLGAVHFERGEFAQAERLMRSALERFRSTLATDELPIMSQLQDLGAAMHAQGKLEEAEEYYREALAGLEAALGSNHPLLVEPLSNLAALALDNGDAETALRMFNRALSIQRARLGEEHPDVARTLCYLGVAEDARGHTEEAVAYLRQAADLQHRVLPRDHLELAVTLSLLGDILAQTGKPDEGEPVLREALGIRRRVLSDDHWQTAVSRSMLGDCHRAQGRYEEAEQLLLPTLRTIADALGPGHELTFQAAQRAVRLYDEWGKPEKADEIRRVWLDPLRDDSPDSSSDGR
jgi:serine/threonine protein kinase/tetratricopeptide (TPR) repeat protein